MMGWDRSCDTEFYQNIVKMTYFHRFLRTIDGVLAAGTNSQEFPSNHQFLKGRGRLYRLLLFHFIVLLNGVLQNWSWSSFRDVSCFMSKNNSLIVFFQAVDRAKNTPLHVIVLYKKIVSDFLTLHAIILALLESGELDWETSSFYGKNVLFHCLCVCT